MGLPLSVFGDIFMHFSAFLSTRRQFRHGVLCGRLRNEAHGSGVGTLFRFSQAKRPLSKLISFPYAIIMRSYVQGFRMLATWVQDVSDQTKQ